MDYKRPASAISAELTNIAILTEEVGELARIMARKYGDQSFKESDKKYNLPDDSRCAVGVDLPANQTGVDLTEALEKTLKRKIYGMPSASIKQKLK